ncbi:MAG: pyruvate, water dikinase regulatory protein [Burkholderiaceae bacterium]
MPNKADDKYERSVFFVSDGTGITAETFGTSLLSQFDNLSLRHIRLPFIDSVGKAMAAVQRINEIAGKDGNRPVVFSTLIDEDINGVVRKANCLYLELFQTFVTKLEVELGKESSHQIGQSHAASDENYEDRIAAINYSLAHDDGQSNVDLGEADVILVGVSRSGKTPTSLYLALQHGVKAANYPLIPEDFERKRLPEALYPVRSKLYGLSISPDRLAEVREARRPGSKYASLANCRMEVGEAEAMMRREGIQWQSSTNKSIEEIAANVLQLLA